MPVNQVAGVLPVVQTPLLADELVDETVLAREIDWLFASGADGLTFAMVSEVLRFTDSERRSIAEFLCSAASGRGPVVVSVVAESTRIAVGLAEHAERVGAQAVMAVPPLHLSLDAGDLLTYFSEIARATTLPVVVQDASGYVGRPIPLRIYRDLLDSFGERIMFKPEAQPIGQRLSELLAATDDRAAVFEGSGGGALLETFPRGLVGTMPGSEVCWAIRALWDALVAGDARRAEVISLPLIALIALQTTLDAFVAVEKYLLVKQGVFISAAMRAPVGYRLDDVTANQVDRYFELLRTACGGRAPGTPPVLSERRGTRSQAPSSSTTTDSANS